MFSPTGQPVQLQAAQAAAAGQVTSPQMLPPGMASAGAALQPAMTAMTVTSTGMRMPVAASTVGSVAGLVTDSSFFSVGFFVTKYYRFA